MEKLKNILSSESKDLKVLDVGTGIGSFIEVLQDSLPGYSNIIGIDTKKESLARAIKEYEDERTEFMCMDGADMKFDNDSIDIISISNTIHHLPNKEKVLSEIKRVLKPNGLIIINEMISDNQSEKQLSHVKIHHLQGEIDTYLGICHNKTFSENELVKIVEDLNLEIVDKFKFNTHEEQEENEDLEEEKEILDQCFQGLASVIREISDLEMHEKYSQILEGLKSELYSIGVFGATELMIVCRKN